MYAVVDDAIAALANPETGLDGPASIISFVDAHAKQVCVKQ